MAELLEPLPSLTDTKEAAEKLTKVIDDTGKAMKDLRSKTHQTADDQKKSFDKVKESLVNQQKVLDEQEKTVGKGNYQFQTLTAQAKELTDIFNTFGDDSQINATEFSHLTTRLENLNKNITKLDMMKDEGDDAWSEDFEKWADKINYDAADRLTTAQRWQAFNANMIADSVEKFSIGDTLKGGLGIISPELVSIAEYFSNNWIVKSAIFGAKRLLKDRAIGKREKHLQRAQIEWYDRSHEYKNPEDFQTKLAEKNAKPIENLQRETLKWQRFIRGKGWFEREDAKWKERLSGVSIEPDQLAEFTNSISRIEFDGESGFDTKRAKEDSIKHKAEIKKADIETRSEKQRLENVKLEKAKIKAEKDSTRQEKQDVVDYLNAELTKSPVGDYDGINELLNQAIEEKTIVEQGFAKIATEYNKGIGEYNKILTPLDGINTILEKSLEIQKAREKGSDAGELTPEEVKLREEQIQAQVDSGEKIEETISRTGEGSPPYLLSLLEFFKGGEFEKMVTPKPSKSSIPESTEESSGLLSKVTGMAGGLGAGALAGISAFMAGLQAMATQVITFFQTVITGIANTISRVAKVISKTFIQLMGGLGKGIATLFMALGSIPPPILLLGAAALGVIAASVLSLGLALKLAAPFVTAVLGGLAKILKAIGTVVKIVADAIVSLLNSITENIMKLAEIPLSSYLAMAAGFMALGASLFYFGTTSFVAIPSLIALGIAATGLSKLFTALPPDKMSLMAMGFRDLAGAVREFGLSALFLGPAVGLFSALNAIPFVGKLIEMQIRKGKVDQSSSPKKIEAETLSVEYMEGGMRANSGGILTGLFNAGRDLLGNDKEAKDSIASPQINTINAPAETTFVGSETANNQYLTRSIQLLEANN